MNAYLLPIWWKATLRTSYHCGNAEFQPAVSPSLCWNTKSCIQLWSVYLQKIFAYTLNGCMRAYYELCILTYYQFHLNILSPQTSFWIGLHNTSQFHALHLIQFLSTHLLPADANSVTINLRQLNSYHQHIILDSSLWQSSIPFSSKIFATQTQNIPCHSALPTVYNLYLITKTCTYLT